MKTHEELFYQFQSEFDKKRKRSLIALLYKIPIWVLFIYYLSFISIFIVKGHFSGEFIKEGWGMEIFMIFMTVFLLIFLLLSIVWPPLTFFHKYNIKGLIECTQSNIKTLHAKKADIKTKLDQSKEKFLDIKAFYDWICSTEIETVIGQNNWQNYLTEMLINSEHDMSIHQQYTDQVDNEIQEFEIRLDMYCSVPEMNFCQYLKSMKWSKKIK